MLGTGLMRTTLAVYDKKESKRCQDKRRSSAMSQRSAPEKEIPTLLLLVKYFFFHKSSINLHNRR